MKIKLRKTSNSIRTSTAKLLLLLLLLLLLPSPPLLLYIILLPLLLASLPVPVRQSPVGTHTCWGTAYERLLFFLLVVLLVLVLLIYYYYYSLYLYCCYCYYYFYYCYYYCYYYNCCYCDSPQAMPVHYSANAVFSKLAVGYSSKLTPLYPKRTFACP